VVDYLSIPSPTNLPFSYSHWNKQILGQNESWYDLSTIKSVPNLMSNDMIWNCLLLQQYKQTNNNNNNNSNNNNKCHTLNHMELDLVTIYIWVSFYHNPLEGSRKPNCSL
jgi:hypothetical protein